MKNAIPSADEIVTRGQRVYDEKIRALLEPSHKGQFAVINIDTGDFEVDPVHLVASERAHERWPQGLFYAVRVGYRTLGHIGGKWKASVE